jgi:hypothetical protein
METLENFWKLIKLSGKGLMTKGCEGRLCVWNRCEDVVRMEGYMMDWSQMEG